MILVTLTTAVLSGMLLGWLGIELIPMPYIEWIGITLMVFVIGGIIWASSYEGERRSDDIEEWLLTSYYSYWFTMAAMACGLMITTLTGCL